MTMELDLFDLGTAMMRAHPETPGGEAVREAREEAIDRAEAGAGEDWMALALAAIERVEPLRTFTTDDLWSAMGKPGEIGEPRAMGAAIRKAAGKGCVRPVTCECCGQQMTATGPERNHGRRMAVWQRV